MKKINYRFIGAVLAASLAFYTGAHAQIVFNGSDSSDPTDGDNYNSGTAPSYGTTISGNLGVDNGALGNQYVYSSSLGSTTFNGNVRVGDSATNSELDITGGNLTFNSSGTSTVGYSGNGTIGVSGGIFSINGGDTLWFANDHSATANVSGGEFIVGDQFLFSRDGGTATINLSGNGVFNVTGANGTAYNTQNNGVNAPGMATININGDSIFEQTGSGSINLTQTSFNTAGPNLFNINFGSGSLGQFSLLGDSTATLDTLIQSGHFEIGGVTDSTLADYNVIGAANSTSQGVIELAIPADVPEPSTWGLMLGGVTLLVFVQRRRFSKV